MKSMKSITTAGLCLVAMLVVSMVAAASASAAPHWLHCVEGTTGTKYTTSQCKTAGTGSWTWQEVTGTEAVVSHASLLLTDTKTVAGEVTVECTGKDEGTVGPGKFDRITAITEINCVNEKNCETVVKPAEPLNLPWQTELAEVPAGSGKIRDNITAVNGKGAGWAVTCKVSIFEVEDKCTTEEGSVGVQNVTTPGVPGELLVLGDFEKESAEANCTASGKKTGRVVGTVALLQANGQGLRATL